MTVLPRWTIRVCARCNRLVDGVEGCECTSLDFGPDTPEEDTFHMVEVVPLEGFEQDVARELVERLEAMKDD